MKIYIINNNVLTKYANIKRKANIIEKVFVTNSSNAPAQRELNAGNSKKKVFRTTAVLYLRAATL